MALIDLLARRQGDDRDWEFASRKGINPNTWYKWRMGLNDISLEGCELLAAAFADDAEVLAAIREYLVERVDAAALETVGEGRVTKKATGPLKKNGKK